MAADAVKIDRRHGPGQPSAAIPIQLDEPRARVTLPVTATIKQPHRRPSDGGLDFTKGQMVKKSQKLVSLIC